MKSKTCTKEEAAVRIIKKCEQLCKMLLSKNDLYDNSVLGAEHHEGDPTREQLILARLDDKRRRIRSANTADDEDLPMDSAGYFILMAIGRDLDREHEATAKAADDRRSDD